MVTVALQFSVFLMVTVTLNYSATYGHCNTAVLCFSWSLSLWSVQLVMVTVTLQWSVLLMVTVNLKCAATNGHCHFEFFSSLWSLSHCSVQCS